MPKKYDGPIDRNTDFTHAGPHGEPASGLAVQNYIKGIDSKKFGAGFTTEDGTEHLFFLDEKDMNEYIADPTKKYLIKDRIEMESQYAMAAELLSPSFNPVFVGSTGNYIRFSFATTNKTGQTVSESVVVTYTITRGGTTQTVTENYRAGTIVAFNVDKYLLEGANSINITIKGQVTKASTALGVVYQVVNLTLSDGMDISVVHDNSVTGASLAVPYAVSGTGQKVMEWYVDGERLDFVQDEDEILESSAERTKYIAIDGLTQGKHSLQFRVGVQVSGETFYSQNHYREFFVDGGASGVGKHIAVAVELPVSAGILGENDSLTIYLTQYEPFNLRVATWDEGGQYKNTVTLLLGNEEYASVLCTEGEEESVGISVGFFGLTTVNLNFNDEPCYSFVAAIAETSMDIHEITSDLELAFSSEGRTNASSNKDSWTDGVHSATFTGFDWTETSGWVNGGLLIPSGASLSFGNYAPLSADPSNMGKTLEFEFKSVNVDDEDAVLCDLTNVAGTGIKITATEIIVQSRSGVVMSRRYKTDENIRVSIVMNRRSGSTNKGLAFVYFNGVNSIAVNVANSDSFQSGTPLTFGGQNAGIFLKQVRIYNTALSNDAVLNNHILYRDSIAEMVSLYDRNDLYEEGTTKFDVNKIASYLPVMIITGNIPAIENTTDKKLQIVADIRYINLQMPKYSFTMKDAIITGQGTSSMTYPRKNLRIYTQKSDATVLLDADGAAVPSKLWSFKPGAQPVNCWCLKTDFAESSGTHNTGVARLWNDALKNAQVNGEYVLRTEAQKKAAEAGYQYDVRTAIDGFPIVVFYHLTEEDDLIFLGKFNFNNDKSTESVFGFKDIPGFDNSHVQCFECLDSGNSLALFQTVEGFDENWSLAWESRYPDTKTPNLAPLKALSTWIASTQNDLQKWVDEKAQHFNLPMLAAYYVYLMRHGAVDQTVKNSMLTTEDGSHFFFILYDNDTINGVRNDGLLRYGPDINRQTMDAEIGGYAYAGHGSVLWNNFEADPECMELAKQVDSALYSAGITYENVINMFNEQQAGKWAEKVYNQDAQYKYIGPYVNKGLNYLGALQGSRSDHRKWWLSNRFALYDALWVNGSYTGKNIHFLAPFAPAGIDFTLTAGKKFYYGYSRDSVVQESGVLVNAGASHTFTTTESLEIGTAIRIFAPFYIESLDLNEFMQYIGAANFDLSAAFDPALGSNMKTLILGVSNPAIDQRRNNALAGLSGLSDIVTLENLNVAGFQALLSLDLSTLVNLKTFKAKASGLTSVTFASGAPLTSIELPSATQVLALRNLAKLTTSGIDLEDNGENIFRIDIRNCQAISNSPDLLLDWLDHKLTDDEDCEVYMDNVNWNNVDPEDLLAIGQIKVNGGSLSLRGRCRLTDATREVVQQIMDIFGASAFQPGSDFYISAPDAVYITGPSVVLEGDTAQFVAAVFSEYPGTVTWNIVSGSRTGVSLNSETGVMTTVENGLSSSDITIRCVHRPTQGATSYAEFTVQVKQRVYPNSNQVNITGNASIIPNVDNIFGIEYTIVSEGNMNAAWALTGDLASYAQITSQSNNGCVVRLNSIPSGIITTGTLTLTLTKVVNGATVCTKTLALAYQNDDIAVSRIANPLAMDVLYGAGLCASNDYMTKAEAASVSEIDLQPGSSYSTSIFAKNNNFRNYCTSFDEFKWFTGLFTVPEYLFSNCSGLTSITIPSGVTSIGSQAFFSCSGLTSITIPSGVTSIGNSAFNNCRGLTSITIPSGVTSIGSQAFFSCSGLTSITIPSCVTSIGNMAFYNCNSLTSVAIDSDVPLSSFPAGSWTLLLGPSLSTLSVDGLGDSRRNINAIIVDPNNQTFYDGGCNCVIQRSDNTLILGCKETIIPSGVTSIGRYAFSYCRLTSITIPSGVTSIGNLAFSYCSVLTSITIPSSVTSIGSSAFVGCSGLTSITIPSGVTSIGAGVFSYCSGLTSITIPSGVTSIGYGAFTNCSGLTSITIPSGVTSIGRDAFKGCSGLTSITIPDSVTTIASEAFSGCSGLTSITIPSGVTSIDSMYGSPFSACPGLTSIVVSPENTVFYDGGCNCVIQRSSNTLIFGCKGTIIPNGVTKINTEAFKGSSGLTDITIPDTVTRLGYMAFRDCSGLTSIVIGSGVLYIDNFAFSGCTALSNITCKATVPPNTLSLPETNYVQHIYVPAGSVEAYKTASVWSAYASVIEAIPE